MFKLPYEEFEIRTSMTPDKVMEKIKENVDDDFHYPELFYSGNKLYKGEITRIGFHIKRILQFERGTLPWIYGTVFGGDAGSIIRLELRYQRGVYVFHYIWMFLLSTFFLTALFLLMRGDILEAMGAFFPVALFLLFEQLIVRFYLKNETVLIKKLLEDIFKSK